MTLGSIVVLFLGVLYLSFFTFLFMFFSRNLTNSLYQLDILQVVVGSTTYKKKSCNFSALLLFHVVFPPSFLFPRFAAQKSVG